MLSRLGLAKRIVDDPGSRRLGVYFVVAARVSSCDLFDACLPFRGIRRQRPKAPHQLREVDIVARRSARRRLWRPGGGPGSSGLLRSRRSGRGHGRKIGIVYLHVEQLFKGPFPLSAVSTLTTIILERYRARRDKLIPILLLDR